MPETKALDVTTIGNEAMESVVEEIVTYHKPDETAILAISNVRAAAKGMILAILKNCPKSPDRSAAIRKVREAMMTANASIVVPQVSV